ncbi:MAG: threonine--tRNA ligase [Saprospiraceae bacterium]|nr:threonine--tRNA ligase [Saprospiraceae bacterium]HMW38224.1 threonine--tRNA ligase [Saprospiraceae bacterium]HMX87419.1 threonine--tRNA ligase [Saprospiraceae bacterium]HMZ39246.1 threonine--tRNA ligase [Saprospiraceae bacterium]HNA65165.1 threonine--tRNA ligase [Saprospiraceae bacterium]
MIKISFPDGRVKEYPVGVTAHEIALSISEGLARNILSAKVNDQVIEINRPIRSDSRIQLLTWNDKEGKSTFWHSSAHLMAEALEAIYPDTRFGIGPPIENGFYYDVDLGGKTLSSNDLQAIENKMNELARQNNPYIRQEISKADAIAYFTERNDPYKLELLQDLEDGQISFYSQGKFTDLCRGPHLPNTGLIKAIKLTSLAGAYWRGDEKRQQLTRIYGITFPKQKELDEYLLMLEEARKRDHRKLGQELELFMFSERVGAGLPIWLPKGTALRQRLEDFLKQEQINRGYTPVITPHIGHKNLYMTSGHWEKYGADSFQAIHTPREGEEFLLKPMNCPHHCEIYGHKPRSYKELPLRIAEFGTVYRYEQSGELHGLTRVRCFTQDDAHIFCTPDQVKAEFLNVLDLTMHVIRKLGFEHFTAQISLRDPENKEKYIGSEENWIKAESAIIEATKEAGLETITELGEAAFYGPKLDFMVKDALGRSWQLGTIQVDYNLPERFQLEYIGSDNSKHRPVMIHRAPFGSMERFIGVLTEHCAGKFPLWLTPEQYMILPVSDKYIEYARIVNQGLRSQGLRGDIDDRTESIGKKIRDNELRKIPFMLIVGEKEQEQGQISVRKQGSGDQGSVSINDFMSMIRQEL